MFLVEVQRQLKDSEMGHATKDVELSGLAEKLEQTAVAAAEAHRRAAEKAAAAEEAQGEAAAARRARAVSEAKAGKAERDAAITSVEAHLAIAEVRAAAAADTEAKVTSRSGKFCRCFC